MAKIKSKWVCKLCNYETIKYIGKCPDCGNWGSLVEQSDIIDKSGSNNIKKNYLNNKSAISINNIKIENTFRISTKLKEFDNVLGGGGLVRGSLVLLSGDPGVGKSTLLLQTSSNIASQNLKLLYVSSEESVTQIKLRAHRLNIKSENLLVYSQTSLELIIEEIEKLKPDVVIIDSIQTIQKMNIDSPMGTITQIRECTSDLMDVAKSNNITVIVVGHVTKDGAIAGPKVLEHMVDVTIYFEGDKYKTCRVLRAIKNRFGSTDEIGLFNMETTGLKEINNPSEMFLSFRSRNNSPTGNVVVVCNEGSRPILIEIESLVGTTPYPAPRRVANGVDYNRLLQILAVLEKRIGLNLSKHDTYINVAGGINLNEPSCDLGIAISIYSCYFDIEIDSSIVFVGEIGLSGDIRSVNNVEKRILEAQKLGFKTIFIPKIHQKFDQSNFNINIIEVEKLSLVVDYIKKNNKIKR